MLNLTYSGIEEAVDKLAEQLKDQPIQAIYGIPRGGIIPAYMLSQKMKLPLIENLNAVLMNKKDHFVLVVDDIEDSGKTIAKYYDMFKKAGIPAILAVLVTKEKQYFAKHWAISCPGDTWVNFPWEDNGLQEAEGITDNIVRILEYIGEDSDREGLQETPARVQKAYGELFAGYKQDPHKILSKRFTSNYDQMVVLRNVEFTSTCEHHMLPFFGTVSIAYVPDGKVVGISKLARLVDCFARRLQIQEQMTEQIAYAINDELNALGVGVVIKARHMCMMIRGVGKQQSEMMTSKVLGALMDKPAAREEFLNLIKS